MGVLSTAFRPLSPRPEVANTSPGRRTFLTSPLASGALLGMASCGVEPHSRAPGTTDNGVDTGNTVGTGQVIDGFSVRQIATYNNMHPAAGFSNEQLFAIMSRQWGNSAGLDVNGHMVVNPETGDVTSSSVEAAQTYFKDAVILPDGSLAFIGHDGIHYQNGNEMTPYALGDFAGDALRVGNLLFVSTSIRNNYGFAVPVADIGQVEIFLLNGGKATVTDDHILDDDLINPTGMYDRRNSGELVQLVSGTRYHGDPKLVIINPNTRSSTRRISLLEGIVPQFSRIRHTSDENYALVGSTNGSGVVQKVNLNEGYATDIKEANTGGFFHADVAVTGGYVFVSNFYEGTVTVFRESTMEKMATLPLVDESLGVSSDIAGVMAVHNGAVILLAPNRAFEIKKEPS